MENMTKLPPMEIFTDGSCISKDGGGGAGMGGLGYSIKYWGMVDNVPQLKHIEGSKGYKFTTNNRMEISAAIVALTEVFEGIKTGIFKDINQINLMSDSKYLCDAISKNWVSKWASNNWLTSTQSAVKNKDLWEQVIEVNTKAQQLGIILTVTHVLGHNGNEFNEKADKLAVAASNNGATHLIDQVYENSNQNKKTNFGSKTYQTYR